MHQRDRARKVFEDAGTLRTKDAKLQRLIKEVETRPALCWPELADEMRARYPEYKEQLARMLWDAGDKTIRLNIIRHADIRLADEHAAIARVIPELDFEADARELDAIVALGDKKLIELVRKKPHLPKALAEVIEVHPERVKPSTPAPVDAVRPRSDRANR